VPTVDLDPMGRPLRRHPLNPSHSTPPGELNSDGRPGAVRKELRRSGLGSSLVHHAKRALAAAGCMKVNLQVLSSNEPTAAFYESLG